MKFVPLAPPAVVRRVLSKAARKWRRILDLEFNHTRYSLTLICPACAPKFRVSWPPAMQMNLADTFVTLDLRPLRFMFPRRRDIVIIDFWIGMCSRCDTVYWHRPPGYATAPRPLRIFS